jgi:ATP-dependent DNA ligase
VIAESLQGLLYVDHIEEQGDQLFEMICRRDMEGVVAKPKASPYRLYGKMPWVKIKNPEYSQAEGRGELFRSR